MKYLILSVMLIGASNLLVGQSPGDSIKIKKDSIEIHYETYEDLDDLNEKIKEHGVEELVYIDSTLKFKVVVPEWLTIIDTGTPYIFGGTLPEVNHIQNAIVIKSYNKSQKSFQNFDKFEEYVVKDMVFGQPVNWSKAHISMSKKELEEYSELGSSYKVYLMHSGLLYDCQYLLTESETAFIWIDFTATRTTFDENKKRFDEFIKGFEILK
jgi:hypothetical protein